MTSINGSVIIQGVHKIVVNISEVGSGHQNKKKITVKVS